MHYVTQLLLESTFGKELSTFDRITARRLEFVMQTFTIATLSFVYAFFKILFLFGFNKFVLMYAIEIILCILAPMVYRFTKNINSFVSASIIMSYVILFYNNLALGGLNHSSGVLLWGLACVSAGMMFYDKKKASITFASYIALCVLSYVVENYILGDDLVQTINISFILSNAIGIGFMIYAILGVFVQEINGEMNKSTKLVSALQEEQERVEEANVELETMNHSLLSAMDELRSAQSKIIQSEKMASLGRLIAGIAHEINTPVGAIKASAGYINSTVKDNLGVLMQPESGKVLLENDKKLLYDIIGSCADRKDLVSAIDKRKLKKYFKTMLDEYQIEDTMNFAYMLMEIGLDNNPEDEALILKLVQSTNRTYILDTAYVLTSVIRGSENILFATQKITKIVYALRSYAHQDVTDSMVSVSIEENIEVVLTLYYNQLKAGVQVVREYDNIPQIFCYPDDLSQVWTNIIFNAMQAMNNEGELRIGLKLIDGFVHASFTDTGTGIPTDIIDSIFLPFYTTKPIGEGSGLGLDICRRIVDKHNGYISVESQEGKGTTMTIKIPARFSPDN